MPTGRRRNPGYIRAMSSPQSMDPLSTASGACCARWVRTASDRQSNFWSRAAVRPRPFRFRSAQDRKDDRQMTDKDAGDLVISVAVDDAVIARRIVRLLGNVRGIRLSSGGEAADLTIIRQSPPESDLGLTPREKDVLVLLAEGA